MTKKQAIEILSATAPCRHSLLGAHLSRRCGPVQACSLCGGTAGTLFGGAHALCRALAKRGAATPNMGDRCPCCSGARCHPRTAVFDATYANQAAIDRWAPKCETCNGTGAVKP